MQNIEVSDATYRKFVKYCTESGQCASSALSALIETAGKHHTVNTALLDLDCEKAVKETKRMLSHEEVFRKL